MAGRAQAQGEWTRVAALPQGHVLHVQTPQSPGGGQDIQLYSLVDYSQVQHWGSKGERFQSSTARWELNCSTRAYRAMAFTAFADRMGQGAVVAQQNRPTDWASAPVASIPGELLRWACR